MGLSNWEWSVRFILVWHRLTAIGVSDRSARQIAVLFCRYAECGAQLLTTRYLRDRAREAVSAW